MSKEIKKPETEVERHGVCDHKIKELKTEVVRLNDIVGEQNRTISSDKTLIKSLKTTLEALRADAKASQDLHGKNLHEMAHYQICLERRDAELAEAKEQIESLLYDPNAMDDIVGAMWAQAISARGTINQPDDNSPTVTGVDTGGIIGEVHISTTNRPEDGAGVPDDPPGLVRPPDVAFRTAMEHNHIALRAEVEQLKGEFSKMKQIMFHELAHLGMTVNPDVFEEGV